MKIIIFSKLNLNYILAICIRSLYDLYIKKEKIYLKFRKVWFYFLLSFVWLLIDSLFSAHFLAKKILLCFSLMYSAIPDVIALVPVALFTIGLIALIKELFNVYKMNLVYWLCY